MERGGLKGKGGRETTSFPPFPRVRFHYGTVVVPLRPAISR
jgi:hypothetical protein